VGSALAPEPVPEFDCGSGVQVGGNVGGITASVGTAVGPPTCSVAALVATATAPCVDVATTEICVGGGGLLRPPNITTSTTAATASKPTTSSRSRPRDAPTFEIAGTSRTGPIQHLLGAFVLRVDQYDIAQTGLFFFFRINDRGQPEPAEFAELVPRHQFAEFGTRRIFVTHFGGGNTFT